MPTKPIDRLLFAQGGLCFFCQRRLPPADATVEHLVAVSNGGGNDPENTVACCKSLNTLLGRMSLKEKLRVVLNQKGQFKCPNGSEPPARKSAPNPTAQRLALVIADLRRRGASRPRTVKTLGSTIGALFQKQLSEQEIAALLARLQAQGIVSIDGTRVTYALPPA